MKHIFLFLLLITGCLKAGEQKKQKTPVFIQVEAVYENEPSVYSDIIYIK